MPRLTVLGSLNMDISVAVRRLPAAGETVLGSSAVIAPGGKGANQAMAAARLGAAVRMIGCTGDDNFGAMARSALEAEGVDVTGVRVIGGSATGLALITVDSAGENIITVAGGANGLVGETETAAALSAGGDILVLSAEIPRDALAAALADARAIGLTCLLNLAPAPAEPAAPNASRQNCSLAEAWCALFLISSSAKVLVSSFLSSSITSMPLTIAPTGLIKSWHTREHTNAARSRALIAREPETGADVSADDVEVEDVGVEEDVGGAEGADIGKLRSATLEPAPCHSTADSAIGQRLSVITLCYKTRPRLAATGHHKGAPWQVPTPVLSSWTALPPSESRPHKPSWLARRITKSASKPTARR